jgi:hypothetical protein
MRRFLDIFRRTAEADRCLLKFLTVHHSSSHPTDASCAAWDHDTERAVKSMKRVARKLHEVEEFRGRLVAVPVKIDTDFDTIELIGPEGSVDVARLLVDERCGNGERKAYIVSRLRDAFPPNWMPILRLSEAHRARFHEELAELVEANLNFARRVKDAQRPIELLMHQERCVRIGRGHDLDTAHNECFLIDDQNPFLKRDLMIALKYVAMNVITDALDRGNENWVIPVFLNIPYDEGSAIDRGGSVLYARALTHELARRVARRAPSLIEHLLEDQPTPAGAPRSAAFREAVCRIPLRIAWCATVASRTTRLYEPIEV